MEGAEDSHWWMDVVEFYFQTHPRCPPVIDNSACEQHEWQRYLTDWECGAYEVCCARCGRSYGDDAAC
jgi:hypothetical protein